MRQTESTNLVIYIVYMGKNRVLYRRTAGDVIIVKFQQVACASLLPANAHVNGWRLYCCYTLSAEHSWIADIKYHRARPHCSYCALVQNASLVSRLSAFFHHAQRHPEGPEMCCSNETRSSNITSSSTIWNSVSKIGFHTILHCSSTSGDTWWKSVPYHWVHERQQDIFHGGEGGGGKDTKLRGERPSRFFDTLDFF